jgi:hypothetical protein
MMMIVRRRRRKSDKNRRCPGSTMRTAMATVSFTALLFEVPVKGGA